MYSWYKILVIAKCFLWDSLPQTSEEKNEWIWIISRIWTMEKHLGVDELSYSKNLTWYFKNLCTTFPNLRIDLLWPSLFKSFNSLRSSISLVGIKHSQFYWQNRDFRRTRISLKVRQCWKYVELVKCHTQS